MYSLVGDRHLYSIKRALQVPGLDALQAEWAITAAPDNAISLGGAAEEDARQTRGERRSAAESAAWQAATEAEAALQAAPCGRCLTCRVAQVVTTSLDTSSIP